MTKDKGTLKRRESASGFHFVNLYQSCPRKWYFRYLKGWQNKIVAQPLVLGGAFHEGKAEYYRGQGEGKAIQVAMDVVEKSKKELEIQDLDEIRFKIPHLLHYWIEVFGKQDRKAFKFLAIERQWEVPIEGTPFTMTIRPDTVVKDKSSDLVMIMETKTSGFSSRITEEGVQYGDQATAYLFGVNKMTKWKPYAVLPDIAYWNSKTRNLDNMKMTRGDLVFRDEERQRNFEKGIGQLFLEMSQKAKAYEEGFDPWVLFPRNSYYCMSFSRACEFADVCGFDCENRIKKPPVGFRKIGGIKKIGGYVEDAIGNG